MVDAQSKTNCFQNKYNNTMVYCSILFQFHASSTNVFSIGAEAKADIICLSPIFHSRWLMLLEIEISFNDRNCYVLGFNELKWNEMIMIFYRTLHPVFFLWNMQFLSILLIMNTPSFFVDGMKTVSEIPFKLKIQISSNGKISYILCWTELIFKFWVLYSTSIKFV